MAEINLRQDSALGSLPLSKGTVAVAWLVFLFLIMPTFVIIPMSFGDRYEIYFPPRSLSLFLYKQYFFEDIWMETTIQSFNVAVASMLLGLFFGTTAAYGVVRAKFRGNRLIGIFLLSPMFVPAIVIALGLYIYFAVLGIQGTTTSIILGHAVFVTPFVMVLTMASLRGVDPNLEAAARIMGAGPVYVFIRVTLPLMKPALVAASLFAFLMSFDELIIAWFVSGAGTHTLPVKMYDSILFEISPVLSAVSVLLTVLAFVICVTITSLRRK